MNQRRLCILFLGLLLLTLLSPQQTQAAQPKAADPAMYVVGNGRTGLFHNELTVDAAKKLITGVYSGKFNEAKEPTGEGTTAIVINAYFDPANDKQLSLKITLDNTGSIYQIAAYSPEFKTIKGLHVGSTWADIRSAYPLAKVTVEGIIGFIAEDRVTCELSDREDLNWQKIKSGEENPPDDLKIIRLFTY
jgi:hypothetical protein